MLQIRSILAPTDFSRHSERAVRLACDMAERFGADLHLLHILPDVIVPVGPDPALITTVPPEYYADTEAQSMTSLEKVVQPGWGQPASVDYAVRWGDAVEAIVGYATEHGIDLVVVATHGRTGLSHMLLGSVAEKIVRTAPCPVLTIRERGEDGAAKSSGA